MKSTLLALVALVPSLASAGSPVMFHCRLQQMASSQWGSLFSFTYENGKLRSVESDANSKQLVSVKSSKTTGIGKIEIPFKGAFDSEKKGDKYWLVQISTGPADAGHLRVSIAKKEREWKFGERGFVPVVRASALMPVVAHGQLEVLDASGHAISCVSE